MFLKKKVPISTPVPTWQEDRPGPGWTDEALPQPRQQRRGQVIEEWGLPTRVATQLLGYVLTAWPRSKREGQPLGSNPVSIHRGKGSQGPGRMAAATPQGDTPGRSVGPTAGGGASQDATWGLKRRLLLKQLTENKASPPPLEGPGGQREGHLSTKALREASTQKPTAKSTLFFASKPSHPRRSYTRSSRRE